MSTYTHSYEDYHAWVLSYAESRGATGATISPNLFSPGRGRIACSKPIEILDGELLERFIGTSGTEWMKKQVRLNTREFYSSTRFGLVLEELEGYSGLIAASLTREYASNYQLYPVQHSFYPLLGTFDFDPVKVYDLNLASDVSTSYQGHAVDMLAAVLERSHAHVAGFRLQRCFDSEACMLKSFANQVGLYLLSGGRVGLAELLAYTDVHSRLDSACSHSLEWISRSHHSLAFLEGTCSHFAGGAVVPILERFTRLGCVVYENVEIRELLRRELKYSVTGIEEGSNIEFVLRVAFLAGPRLMSEPTLCLVLFNLLQNTVGEKVYKLHIEALLSICVLPGMSLIRPNPQLSSHVLNLIKMFSFSARTKIYKHATSSFTQTRYLGTLADRATRATQRILRRLSKENSKHLGRKLGKLMNRYPCTVVRVVLEQVQSYPNMIQVVVESLKYSSTLSLDVLVNYLIVCMSSSKSKIKSDGQHVELWFSSLCSFAGALFKRFKLIDLSATLQYVLNTVKDGQILDLLILKELITQMTGIEVLRDISETQRLLLSAGSHLQMHHASKVIQKRNMTGAARLRRALKTSDSSKDIAFTLLIMIYKCKNNIMMGTSHTQLKFVGQWYDECQSILLQYINFLQFAYSNEEYSALFPSMGTLAHEYGLDNAIIFHLYRPIARQIQRKQLEGIGPSPGEERVWHTLLQDAQTIFPMSVWENVSLEFCMEFWCMDGSDIFLPAVLYEDTIAKCKQDLNVYKAQLQGEMTLQVEHQLLDLSSTIDILTQEYSTLSSIISQNRKQLTTNMSTWIRNSSQSSTALTMLQYFVFPRSKLSYTDAFYASQFMSLMHTSHTPRFSTLQYHDVLFRDFAQLVFSCSESESTHFGIFMLETLRQLSRWRDPTTYALQCAEFDGFSTRTMTSISTQAKFSEFLKISYKWQHRIAKALLLRLSSSDYMELRNVLIVLVVLVDQFPVVSSHGRHLCKHVERIIVKDNRGDVTTVAKRYLSMLKSVQLKWQPDENFSANEHFEETYNT
uniref:THO complex subunit 2 n=1 Tax=Ostreococcus mediterraneus TaxID=1486918 RepID=A0A6T5ZBG9_9CHLO|mmetsp:Transcript_6801/g.15059  ORF Transcript_6801/g.15059 Transcript_6801/m.15059 type:complete len:1023 (+) Transcript_6801:121-3189(+)